MSKVWRNAEGREVEVDPRDNWGCVPSGLSLPLDDMAFLGYELVEKEPVSFEGAAREGQSWHVGCSILADPRLVPGKKYKVTEVVE